MLYNIFEKFKKQKRRSKNKIKPRIIIDIHEKDSMILAELKTSNEIETQVKNLKIGDYLIENIVIERKTTSDFISSMLSKRLIEQIKNMQKYKQKLLIIEGNLEDLINQEGKLNPNSLRGFILSIINNYDIPIIFSKDYQDTTNYLITLAKQQNKKRIQISLHSRIPKTIKEQKQYILEAFPNIGPKKAELLLKKFKSLNNVFNASEDELKEILKNKVKDFKQLLLDH